MFKNHVFYNEIAASRLRNITVALSNHTWPSVPGFLTPDQYEVFTQYAGPSTDAAIHNLTSESDTHGPARYLYIVKINSDVEPLTLCEVEVFAHYGM